MSQQNSKSGSNSPIATGCGYLVFLISVGIITAVAFPSFRNRSQSGQMLSESKQYVSSMNKGQQAYFAEQGSFANSVEALGLGLKSETKNYQYSSRATKQAAFNYGVSKQPQLKSFIGGVFVVPAKEVDTKAIKDKMTTASILCDADSPGTIKPAEPTYENGKIAFGKGTTKVTR